MPSKRARSTSLVGVALGVALTLGWAAPASAAQVQTYPAEVFPGLTVESAYPNYVLSVDCDEWEEIVAFTIEDSQMDYGDLQLIWVPGGTAEVRFDCELSSSNVSSLVEAFEEDELVGAISELDPSDGAVAAYAISPNTYAEMFLGDGKVIRFAYSATVPIADPAGELIFTEDFTMAAEGESAGDFGDGDDLLCQVGGERVYATLDVSVTEAGTFTFRVVSVDPVQSGKFVSHLVGEFVEQQWEISLPNPWGDYVPISDPLVILYDDFDPAQLDENQIACNDDSEALSNDESYASRDGDDRFLPTTFSELVVDLEPGNYTFVVTTFDQVRPAVVPGTVSADGSSADLSLEQAGYQLADLPEQSASVQFWGTGSMQLGHTAQEELADTGADESLHAGLAAGAVLALMLGAMSLVVARRRSA